VPVYEESVEAGKEQGKSDAYLLEQHIDEHFERKQVDAEEFEEQLEYFGAAGETDAYLLARNEEDAAM